MSSDIFASISSAILLRVYKSGWVVLVHHLDTVVGLTSNCSASHLLVRFFSQSTVFRRFKSCVITYIFNLDAKIVILHDISIGFSTYFFNCALKHKIPKGIMATPLGTDEDAIGLDSSSNG